MENGVAEKELEKQVAPEQSQGDRQEPVGPFVGGEVHIISNAKDGSMQVSAPQNLVLALGLIEVAKAILIQKQQQTMRATQEEALRRPAIVRAGPQDVSKLARPS